MVRARNPCDGVHAKRRKRTARYEAIYLWLYRTTGDRSVFVPHFLQMLISRSVHAARRCSTTNEHNAHHMLTLASGQIAHPYQSDRRRHFTEKCAISFSDEKSHQLGRNGRHTPNAIVRTHVAPLALTSVQVRPVVCFTSS